MTRLLILGTGGMANTHAEAFAAIPGVELVAGVDPRPEPLAAFAQKHGLQRTFTTLQEALAWGEFDAATNVTPDGAHYATTLPLRGSLEKPDAQLWPAIIGVLRNAFVDSLGWGFGDLPVATAPKKENIIEQTVKGLDKKEPGPKAQPKGGQ